ncbi:MAG: hypothetical protein O2782_10910 [bacterium]|nr:hypothetical protein [bacterium]
MDRLLNIDRRIIFIFVLLGVAIPLLIDIHLPIKPTPTVRAVYDEIERVSIEDPDRPVLVSFSYGASTMPEMEPMTRSILHHLFSRGRKVVGICLWPEAVGLAQPIMDELAAEFGMKYGTDYAFLGYKPGAQAVVLNLGQSMAGTFPFDTAGTPVGDLPILAKVQNLKDFSFVFDFAAGDSMEFWWIPYGQEKHRFPFAGGCTAVMAPDLYPFLQSRQLVGLLGGLAGAAEYEALIGVSGSATSGMEPQSVTHVIIILFILLGNTVYFTTRRRGGKA